MVITLLQLTQMYGHDRLKQLKEASDQTNAEEALSEGTRDGLIYGGSSSILH